MNCGFEKDIPCDKECKYFETCTRNPHRRERKEVIKDGRREVDKDNHRHFQ